MFLPRQSGTQKSERLARAGGRLQKCIDTARAMRVARLLESSKDLAHEGQLRAIGLVREVDRNAADAKGGVGQRHQERSVKREGGSRGGGRQAPAKEGMAQAHSEGS